MADPSTQAGEIIALLRRRRRLKFIRFALCETLAAVFLVATVVTGTIVRSVAQPFPPLLRALPIVAAILIGVIPVLFYGHPNRRR